MPCTDVDTVLCTGGYGLHRCLHWDEAPMRVWLNLALLPQPGAATFHRAEGHAQRLSDRLMTRARLPESDKFRLPVPRPTCGIPPVGIIRWNLYIFIDSHVYNGVWKDKRTIPTLDKSTLW